MHGVFIVRVYALGRGFFFLIKCICIVEFCLSFYFSYHLQFSTLKCRIMLNFVRFCRKLCTLYTIYIPRYIAYNIYSLCILHTLLLYPCIQYTFYYVYNIFSFIYLTRYILYVLRTLFLIY